MNTIHNEDCLRTLARMLNDSVHLVITSPPYNMNLRIRNGKYCSRQIVPEISTKYADFADNMPIDDYYNFHSKVLKELLRVSGLVFYNVAIVTGSKRAVFKMIGEFSECLKDIIVWDKGHGQPAMQNQVLNTRSELILVFEKDYPISRQFRKSGTFKRGTLENLWTHQRAVRKHDKYHGATFPKSLVAEILENFSRPGDIVYDPFMGSGTTAVAAQEMNRQYLGSEISADYIKIAEERIAVIRNRQAREALGGI